DRRRGDGTISGARDRDGGCAANGYALPAPCGAARAAGVSQSRPPRMTGAVLSALASHWRRNRLQLLTLVLGLALATALWSGVQAINAEARASYDAAAATLAEGRFDQLLPRE